MSVISDSDNATLYSAEGQQSVAAVTVSSQVTVKASNKQEKLGADEVDEFEEALKRPSKGWKKFKRLVGVKAPDGTPPRANSKSIDSASERSTKLTGASLWPNYPLRKRVLSADGFSRRKTQTARSGSEGDMSSERSVGAGRMRNQLDLAIRGRLDGMDVLSLGPANRSSLPPTYGGPGTSSKKGNPPESPAHASQEDSEPAQIDLDPLRLAFTDMPTTCTAADMVSDMIRASAGKDQPELILEGFIPGGGDRWSVRLEEPQKPLESSSNERLSSPTPPAVHDDDESTAVLTEDGSTNLPTQKLWDQIWGGETPPPLPSHMQTRSDGEPDDVLQLAAACSVPIDLDEDTFMIDSPAHLRSVHDLVMIPIQVSEWNYVIFFKAC
jgi:hypothetical protein